MTFWWAVAGLVCTVALLAPTVSGWCGRWWFRWREGLSTPWLVVVTVGELMVFVVAARFLVWWSLTILDRKKFLTGVAGRAYHHAMTTTSARFHVPGHYTAGPSYGSFDEAVEAARATIQTFSYGDTISHSRAFVDLRHVTRHPDGGGTDAVLARWEVFIDRVEPDHLNPEAFNPSTASASNYTTVNVERAAQALQAAAQGSVPR